MNMISWIWTCHEMVTRLLWGSGADLTWRQKVWQIVELKRQAQGLQATSMVRWSNVEEYYWPKMENMEELSALPKPRFSILIGNTGWRSRTVGDRLPAGGKRALLAVEVCGGDFESAPKFGKQGQHMHYAKFLVLQFIFWEAFYFLTKNKPFEIHISRSKTSCAGWVCMLGELGEPASEDSGNRASLQMQWHLGSSDHRQDGEIQLVSVGFSWICWTSTYPSRLRINCSYQLDAASS